MVRRKTIPVLKYVFIYLIALLIILPILYMFLSSFKNPGEVNKMVSLPSGFYLENYKAVFQNDTAVRSFANSGIISVFTIAIDILLCALASYALARRKEKYFLFCTYYS